MIFLFIVGLVNAVSYTPDQCSQIQGELIKRFRAVGLPLVGSDRVADVSCHCKKDCPAPLRIYSLKKISEQQEKLLAAPCAASSTKVYERATASNDVGCDQAIQVLKNVFVQQPHVEKAFYDPNKFEGRGSKLKTCSCPSDMGVAYPGVISTFKTLDCSDCSGPGCDCH